MATAAAATAIPAVRKTMKGTVFSVSTVELPQREQDKAPREMGVVWITDGEGNPERYTDFSGMHKILVEDKAVRAVFDETIEERKDAPVRVHRNLVTVVQPEA